MNSELTDCSGHVGHFSLTARDRESGAESQFETGAIIVASGGSEFETTEYLRGRSDKVWTQIELDRYLHEEPAKLEAVKNVVMVQCVPFA